MEDRPEETETVEETIGEIKEAIAEEAESVEPVEPPKSKPRAVEKAAKPSKQDKIECQDCGKVMTANTLRYKHTCKPEKSKEIQKEAPRKRETKRLAEPPTSKSRKSKSTKKEYTSGSESEEEEEEEEKPKRTKAYSPTSPRTKMVQYYREAKSAQIDAKRAKFRSWLGN